MHGAHIRNMVGHRESRYIIHIPSNRVRVPVYRILVESVGEVLGAIISVPERIITAAILRVIA